MGKYTSKVLVWEKTTPYKDGPNLVISRDELPFPPIGKRKYVAWAQPLSRRIYISKNCKYRDVLWAHESAHFEMDDFTARRTRTLDTLRDEMLADMKAAMLCGFARTCKALEWIRRNWFKQPSETFLKNMDARIAFIGQLGELLEKCSNRA